MMLFSRNISGGVFHVTEGEASRTLLTRYGFLSDKLAKNTPIRR